MDKKDSIFIAAFIAIAIICSIILKISLLFPFLLSTILSFTILLRRGWHIKKLVKLTYKGVAECKELYLFILLIGANIAIWMASGIVPAMMYYGFSYLQGLNFIFTAFVITALISIFMGTAVGTISTLGLALLGIGEGFAIPPALLLGTLVSGAFITEKVSPISPLLNLTIKMSKTSYPRFIKRTPATFIPILALTATIYLLLGSKYTAGGNGETIVLLQDALQEGFNISPLLLLVPLGVLFLPLKGVKLIPTILTGLVGGTIITLTLQQTAVMSTVNYIFRGYRGETSSLELNSILVSGGVASMIEILLIIISVTALGTLLEQTGMLKSLIYDPVAQTKNKGELILKTGFFSTLLTAITCDQTMGIVLPGKLYHGKYREISLDNAILARTISDTGVISAPLMPWNLNAIIILSITGISAWEYAPYAALCFLFPLTAGWIFGWEHLRRRKKNVAAKHRPRLQTRQ